MPHATTNLNDDDATHNWNFDLLPSHTSIHSQSICSSTAQANTNIPRHRRRRRQPSSVSELAKQAMTANGNLSVPKCKSNETAPTENEEVDQLRTELDKTLTHNTSGAGSMRDGLGTLTRQPPRGTSRAGGSLAAAMTGRLPEVTGATMALNDTPVTTAPNSPRINGSVASAPSSVGSDGVAPKLPPPVRQNSGTNTPRVRPTTLSIPGLTKSKVSPDGRISSRDVGSKLVIVMVGLPARGKSYITKKLARYLNWLQHDTKIFNVGERRRVAAGGPHSLEKSRSQQHRDEPGASHRPRVDPAASSTHEAQKHHFQKSTQLGERPASVAQIFLNDDTQLDPPPTPPRSATESEPDLLNGSLVHDQHGMGTQSRKGMATIAECRDAPEVQQQQQQQQEEENMTHSAGFFDPQNEKASRIREQLARDTLDDLLDYILYDNGSVGILDATNSTMKRRKMVMDRIRERAGPQLNVLFLESRCENQELLEANMRLKLNGPDYRDMDPVIALEDFKKRVREYEKAYVPLGEYEEKNNMPYIQMVDVGRKIISHQINGFLMAQANYYLLNFNLAPRQIWITRHGLSMDNLSGKIGGDSDLAPEGHQYAQSLTRFMDQKRTEWDLKQIENLRNTHFPPQPGDVTPPNPYYHPQSPGSEDPDDNFSTLSDSTDTGYEPKPFCVWTSMLKRSVQTAQYFNDDDYDTKQMRMLDELNAGVMEGLTYNSISQRYPLEYQSRKEDKLHYRYPGPGGEGYLDIINRLRQVIVELERMTDHVLLIGHRSVARVLLAYFRGLKREEVADLDVPLGLLYCLEPKPYGTDFKVYRWDKESLWFYEVPDFQLKRAEDDMI